MNGQLSEHPPAELIREISAKSLSGRLQLQHDRIKVLVYLDRGQLVYAASNLRTLRLREYLLKAGIAEAALARYDDRQPDIELANRLCKDYLLMPAAAEEIQTKQVSDVLRLALSWTAGTWEFDSRSRLSETPRIKIDTSALLLDAARRTPPKFAGSRFIDPAELISPSATSLVYDNLLPAEVFLLSRVDRPMTLQELIAISGARQNEALVLIYSLVLAGFLQRQHWTNAVQSPATPAREAPAAQAQPPTQPIQEPASKHAAEPDDIDTFLERIANSDSHYAVLGVSEDASPAYMKTRYYELARRYHPDRFRKVDASLVARIESAFARITQAYDTLRDDRLRANYDAKLKARQKAQQLADATQKPLAKAQSPVAGGAAPESAVSIAEHAEQQFKEGLAALELGQRKLALGLFASAAKAVPNDARYRAFYGRLLAEQENTRRAAEAELQTAIKLDPKNGEYRAMLAELYRDLGFTLRARGEAERALDADPDNRKARDLLRALKSV